MLFKINLNKLEDKSEVIKKMSKQGYSLIALSLLFITITVFTTSRYSSLISKKNEFKKMTVSLKEQIKLLEQTDQYIGEDQVMDLYDLTNQRIFWSEKLEALADIVDTSVALASISFQRDKLYLKGITGVKKDESKFQTISEFIDSLKASPVFAADFEKIEFSSSDRIKYMNKNIINFEILCLRKQEY